MDGKLQLALIVKYIQPINEEKMYFLISLIKYKFLFINTRPTT
jgi:hypothetical protein